MRLPPRPVPDVVQVPPLDLRTALVLHALFEAAGIAVGFRLYAHELRLSGRALGRGPGFSVALGCIIGAIVGSKAAALLQHPSHVIVSLHSPLELWSGQSIVGALIGGLLGVELAKWTRGARASTGDAFVLPLVVGIAIGRIGCFVAGLHDDTYGVPTALPWGVDFGDGVARHPTQLYDIAFVLVLGCVLHRARTRLARTPGLRFKLFLSGYLLWRLAVDALKPVNEPYVLGASGLQLLIVLFLLAYLPFTLAALRRNL